MSNIIVLTATNRAEKTHGSDFGPRKLTTSEIELCKEHGLNPDGVSHIRAEGETIIIYMFP